MRAREQEGAGREQEGSRKGTNLFLELVELRSFMLSLPHARLPLLAFFLLQLATPVLISLPFSKLTI